MSVVLPPPEEASTDNIITWFMPDGSVGKISWYKSKMSFEATCACPALHTSLCRTTRKSTAPKYSKSIFVKPSQGRCCGYMAAWLLFGFTQDCAETHRTFEPDRTQRRAGRALLKESPMGRKLLSKEAPKGHFESDSEPDICP